ncbi:MAG: peptidylprolyl isomerase [Chloroflexi bacterium]|nr:peptidylprolyl isomerase [Chloroflexota bacterium]
MAALFFLLGVLALAACGETRPSATTLPPALPSGAVPATTAAQAQSGCVNGGSVTVPEGAKLAARVNGKSIALEVYERQAAQSEAALIQQGIDPNSAEGKEAIKGLRAQVLAQLIDDALVEQEALAQNINPSEQEINNRVQLVINDAGGKAKFDEYLTKNQLTLADLCQQIRANVFGEAMMERLTRDMPTQVEQVHVAHILFAKKEDADAALVKLKAGADFGALAKQVSQDEATRDNGGDLGWFPREVMPREFEQAAFALKPGEISGVVSTQLGLHILKLLERDAKRALTPDLIQSQRLAAFNTWLDGVRSKAKIERFVSE